MKLVDALTFALRTLDVRYVFGVSGANIEHLHDAIFRLGDSHLQSVLAKSERGAAYMADARARVHRTLAVCCSTSGGGMLNLLAGVAESYAESVPVLAIVGQPPTSLWGKGAFQDSSGIGTVVKGEQLWKSVSKHVAVLTHEEQFWPALQKSVTECLTGRMGPSVLMIPRDLYEREVEVLSAGHIKSWLACETPKVSPDAVTKVAEAIMSARCPVLIVGQGTRRSPLGKSVGEFVNASQIAVACTANGRAEVSNSSENYLGVIGACGHPSSHRFIKEQADLVVVVGSGISLMNRGPLDKILPEKRLIFVDIDGTNLKNTFPNAEVISTDAGQFFSLLHKAITQRQWQAKPIANHHQSVWEPKLANVLGSEDAAPPRGLLRESEAIMGCGQLMTPRGHLVFDAGNCAAAAIHYLNVPRSASSTIAFGMGAMGYGIPAAIGAQLGSPTGTHTLAFIGDGAFLMEGFEVSAAVELDLPILYVVFNNGMHGMCVTRQQLLFGGRIEASIYGSTNIAQVCRGLAPPEKLWVGQAHDAHELRTAVADYKQNIFRPGVLEIVLGPEEVPPFAPFLPADAVEIPMAQWQQLWGIHGS